LPRAGSGLAYMYIADQATPDVMESRHCWV